MNGPRCTGVAAGTASRDDDSGESGERGEEDRREGEARYEDEGERCGDDDGGDRGGSSGHGGGEDD